jgi:hypothetical protein
VRHWFASQKIVGIFSVNHAVIESHTTATTTNAARRVRLHCRIKETKMFPNGLDVL